MSRLFLTIKKEYFDQIRAGEKKEEYRMVKPHWVKMLVDRNYETVVFQNGYASDAPRVTVKYLGYEIKNITHPFFGEDEITVFAIKLGEITDVNQP